MRQIIQKGVDRRENATLLSNALNFLDLQIGYFLGSTNNKQQQQ